MSRFESAKRFAILLFLLTASVSAFPQDSNGRSGNLTAPSQYPDSPDGLRTFLQDALKAQGSGDQTLLSSVLSNLGIPDHDAWFVRTFGEVEGQRMGAKYDELLPDMPKNFSKMLKYVLDGNRTVVEVSMFQNAADSKMTLMKALTDAMVQPIHLYNANGTSPNQKYGASLGSYAYVEGAFRYMDTNVYLALSTAPPLRIRQGGNITLTSLVYKVDPVYPDDAKRIQGTVVLHAILSVDGAVKELEVVSGDPFLANAAITAVRQWKYKPTLLNGKPVEVDTTVKIDFTR